MITVHVPLGDRRYDVNIGVFSPEETAALLAGAIVLYDALHKALALSPVLMAGCRFLLYPLAASTGALGVP